MFHKKVKKVEKAKKQTKKCFCIIKQKRFHFLFNIFYSIFIQKPPKYTTFKSTWKVSKCIWKRNKKREYARNWCERFFIENELSEKEKKFQYQPNLFNNLSKEKKTDTVNMHVNNKKRQYVHKWYKNLPKKL